MAGYTKALELAPGSATARFGLCMARLPIIYGGEDEIDERRAAYRRELESLSAPISPANRRRPRRGGQCRRRGRNPFSWPIRGGWTATSRRFTANSYAG